jgi:hypothetical protein
VVDGNRTRVLSLGSPNRGRFAGVVWMELGRPCEVSFRWGWLAEFT